MAHLVRKSSLLVCCILTMENDVKQDQDIYTKRNVPMKIVLYVLFDKDYKGYCSSLNLHCMKLLLVVECKLFHT